jgi:UDP-glucuronate decarboxylase
VLGESHFELTGSRSQISYNRQPVDDPLHRCPNIALARSALDGWEPVVHLEDGLGRTIEHLERQLCGRPDTY